MDLLPLEPFGRMFLEHPVYEISEVGAHFGGEFDWVVEDLGLELGDGFGVERWLACEEFIEDDSERPDVNFVSVGVVE